MQQESDLNAKIAALGNEIDLTALEAALVKIAATTYGLSKE